MAEGSWFTASNFIIDGQQGGAVGAGAAALGGAGGGVPSSGGGGGGGWSMSRDEAEAMWKEAREIANDHDAQVREAERLARTQSPSEDFATTEFNKVGNEAWGRGAQSVVAQRDYWQSLADALGKALGHLQEADDEAGQSVGKSAGQDDSGGGVI